jgi:glycosyltransferase
MYRKSENISNLKISIVTPTYNSQETIVHTLASLKRQNYRNLQHILIDGGSTDNTFELARKYALQESICISEPDTGVYSALNKGIGLADGDIIGFLHSDDVFASNDILFTMADKFTDKKCEVVYGDLEYVHEKEVTKVVRKWRTREFKKNWFRFGWMPPHPSVFVRKDVYQRFGLFDESYKISGDYEFLLRIMLSNNVDAFYLDKTIVSMRLGGISNRSIRNLFEKTLEDMRAMRVHGLNPVVGILGKNLSKVPQFF